MLSEIIDEIEERLRRLVREEVRRALSENNNAPESGSTKIKELSIDSEVIRSKVEFPTLLKVEEVAKLLRVGKQKIYEIVRARKTNGFPVIVIGERQYRFSKEAVLEWINKDFTK